MANRTCKVCNTKYSYCPTCREDAFKPTWMSIFCSANCYNAFLTLSNVTNKKITEEMAKEELSKLDLDKVTNESMVKHINLLLNKPMIETKIEKESVIENEIKETEKEIQSKDEKIEVQAEQLENQNTRDKEESVLEMAEVEVVGNEPKRNKTDKTYYGKRKK